MLEQNDVIEEVKPDDTIDTDNAGDLTENKSSKWIIGIIIEVLIIAGAVIIIILVKKRKKKVKQHN